MRFYRENWVWTRPVLVVWADLASVCSILVSPSSRGLWHEKSRKLGAWKESRLQLDTGIWAPTQGPHTSGQYSDSRVAAQVSCYTWSVQTSNQRPVFRSRDLSWPIRGQYPAKTGQCLGRQLQSVLLVLETLNFARGHYHGEHAKHVQTSQRPG